MSWSLRERKSAVFDGNGQATVDFTGGDKLRGGNIDESQNNSINILDYSTLKVNWATLNAIADINGDGAVQTLDYSIMKTYWFQVGDAE